MPTPIQTRKPFPKGKSGINLFAKFDLFTSVFGNKPAFIQIFKDKMREFDLSGNVLDKLLP